jgi:hypothetical protein
MNTDTGNAKRATRATLELARILSDGQWYNMPYLAYAAGRYIRPELVWRRARQHRQKDNMYAGKYQWVLAKLRYWLKVGKVEKQITDGMSMWRVIAGNGWTDEYIRRNDTVTEAIKQFRRLSDTITEAKHTGAEATYGNSIVSTKGGDAIET